MNSKTDTTDESNENPITVIEQLNDDGTVGNVMYDGDDRFVTAQFDLDVLEEAIENFRNQQMVPEDTRVWLHLNEEGPMLLSDWPKNGDAVCAMPIVEPSENVRESDGGPDE